jgi:hypothetical protein
MVGAYVGPKALTEAKLAFSEESFAYKTPVTGLRTSISHFRDGTFEETYLNGGKIKYNLDYTQTHTLPNGNELKVFPDRSISYELRGEKNRLFSDGTHAIELPNGAFEIRNLNKSLEIQFENGKPKSMMIPASLERR